MTINKSLCLACVVTFLSGCGGDDGDRLTGVFLDSPVQGLHYSTPTQQGMTNSAGEFVYKEGESIVFSIGELTFPAVAGEPTVTPLELAQVEDISDEKAVNVLRLLQSIDGDLNPDNGIRIPASAHDDVTTPNLIFDGSLDVDQFITSIVHQAYDDGRVLVSREAAVEHFVDTLTSQVVTGDAPKVDQTVNYLVETSDEYGGDFFSLQDSSFSLKLNDDWESGTVEERNGVLVLKSSNGDSRFLTTGSDSEKRKVFCIGKRPYAMEECAANGKLFVAFSDETEAVAYNNLELAAAQEQEETDTQEEADTREETETQEETAQEETDTSTGQNAQETDNTTEEVTEENTNEQDSEKEEVTEEQTNNENTSTEQTSGEDNTGHSTNDNTNDNTDNQNTSDQNNTNDNTTEQNTQDNDTSDQELEDIVASVSCPTGLQAPAQFTVFPIEPSGCVWTAFEKSPWTWFPSESHVSTSNTVTASVGGTYEGSFEHGCTDNATGRVRKVVASCTVEVGSGPGLADITDLFFITGQSNAAGLETAYDAALDASDTSVFAFTDQGWQVADLHQHWEHSAPGNFSIDDPSRSPYNSIAFQLSRSVAEKSGRVVGLVVLTAPGEGISHWDYNSEFSLQIREKANAALNALPNKSTFDAMIWMQGETDWLFEGTADSNPSGFASTDSEDYKNYYPNKLFQLVSNLRSEGWFGHDGRFICAETKKAGINPHLMALNSDADPLTGCAAAADLDTRPTDPFGNHFSAASLRILGSRLADVYLSMD